MEKLIIATSSPPAIEAIRVDAILADAVVLNWGDLMPGPTTGLIHIEYHVEALGSIEFLKVWASTVRGYWNLICEHWMRWDDSHQSGLHFNNGYKSDGLTRMLDRIMQHQEIFLLGAIPGKDRMIQVAPPTDADRTGANMMMEVFRARLAA
ncbi:MAG: hypothetical protein WBW69_03505 [Candidatus Korobacteraceae bacterium]